MVSGLVPPQFAPGRTVTRKKFVWPLPHASKAEAWTGVVEPRGKQVPKGGLYMIVTPDSEQHGSVAKPLYDTGTQGSHVYTTMLEVYSEMQLVGPQSVLG